MFESVYREMLRLAAYGPADKALRRDYTERLSCCTLHVGLDDLWVLTRHGDRAGYERSRGRLPTLVFRS